MNGTLKTTHRYQYRSNHLGDFPIQVLWGEKHQVQYPPNIHNVQVANWVYFRPRVFFCGLPPAPPFACGRPYLIFGLITHLPRLTKCVTLDGSFAWIAMIRYQSDGQFFDIVWVVVALRVSLGWPNTQVQCFPRELNSLRLGIIHFPPQQKGFGRFIYRLAM